MKVPDKIRGFRSRTINDIIDFIQSLQPIRSSSVKHTWTSHGIAYDVDRSAGGTGTELDATKFSFGVTIAGNVATILAGGIHVSWANYAVGGTSLSLSGSTAWIFVYAGKADLSSNGINFSASEPISSGENYQWPLVKATTSDGGQTYTIADGQIRHVGDFYFCSPINKP